MSLPQSPRSWLGALIALDALFLLAHVLFKFGVLGGWRWSIEVDRGYGEWYMYAKELLALGVFLALAGRGRRPQFLAWAVILFLVFVDDAFMVHERMGLFMSEHWTLPTIGTLRGRDVGELGFFSLLLAGLAGLWLQARVWAGSLGRRTWWQLTLLFGALAGFAVVVDVFHQLSPWRWLRGILALLEDGGELLVMSLILGYLFYLKAGRQALEAAS